MPGTISLKIFQKRAMILYLETKFPIISMIEYV
nr:MAG TPA: hypothetical protein [Caudoviricetes sp.]